MHLKINSLLIKSQVVRVNPFGWTHPFFLAVQGFNPLQSLWVANISQVNLCGWKIRMSEDYFADNFNGNTWTAGESGCMPPKIVRS